MNSVLPAHVVPAAALLLSSCSFLLAQENPTAAEMPIALPPDSPRWQLEGQAEVAEHLGRPCLRLDGGIAFASGIEFQDGAIDVDVVAPTTRGFLGIDFRMADDVANGERVYLRPHKSGAPDAIQYTPVLNTGMNWQIYSGPGFTAAVEIPKQVWFHLRLVVAGAQARLFVGDLQTPALVVDDLKSGRERGGVALYVLTGATCFANFEVRPAPPVAFVRHPPPMAPGTLVDWELSPAYDALARDPEQPLPAAEAAAIAWQRVAAEAPGFVVLYRYRQAPHPRVTFQRDFATRLQPQPGMQVVYARTFVDAERDEVRRLSIGYSDEVSVFLNGRILFRGRSAQAFRDPGFLGILDADDDAVYLPLHAGRNELVLAVGELGGGWGFHCRLTDLGR